MAVPHDTDIPAAGQPAYVATDAELDAHAADTDLHGGTAIAEHIAAPDAHPGYLEDADHDLASHTVLGLATGGDIPTAIAAHEAAVNPHGGYATDADLAAHAAAVDPHTGYLLEADHTLAAHNTLGLATQAELDAVDSAIQTELDTKLSTTGGGKEVINTVAASGAAETLDLADGNVHDVTLTANCTITLAGATAGVACYMTVLLRQDATGGRTATWPVSVEWSSGSAPTLETAPLAEDVITLFTLDGGTTWHGFHAGTEPTVSVAAVGACAKNAATFGLTTTYTAVAFAAADAFDTDGFHNPASNNTRMTVPAGKGGTYILGIEGTITDDTKNVLGYFRKNGSVLLGYFFGGILAFNGVLPGVVLADGDYVEIMARVYTGTANGNSDWNFRMVRVGT